MATPNWTPDNQANVINSTPETPETQTEPTKNQLWELKKKVGDGVLKLTLAWAILAHWVNAPNSQANPIDVQDKPGVTQVVDSSKQERNQLKVEVEDKATEKEILDYYIDKKWWDKVIAKYNSLHDSYKTRVLDYYKNLDWKPMKSVSALITVFNNAQIWFKYITDYEKTHEVWDMPEIIEWWMWVLIHFDPDWKALFSQNELDFFQMIDKTSISINEEFINKTKWEIVAIDKNITTMQSEIATTKGEITTTKGEIATIDKNISKMKEQIKFLKELNKRLSSIN